jgi:hypothetical protein
VLTRRQITALILIELTRIHLNVAQVTRPPIKALTAERVHAVDASTVYAWRHITLVDAHLTICPLPASRTVAAVQLTLVNALPTVMTRVRVTVVHIDRRHTL